MKPKLQLALFFSVAIIQIAISQSIPNAYWRYDFSNGTLTDTGTVGQDLVSNSSTFTAVNDRFTTTNNAISLNGDYLTSGSANLVDVSFSFFIRTSTNDANQRVIINQIGNDSSGSLNVSDYGYEFYLQNGRVHFFANFGLARNNFPHSGGAGASGTFSSTTVLADGQWHHVAVVANYSDLYVHPNGDVRYDIDLYIDGALEDDGRILTNPNTSGSYSAKLTGPNADFRIGQNDDATATHVYQDEIDDIRVIRQLLNAGQVQFLASSRGPQVFYVDVDATGNNDGSSWADAFTYLKDATDTAIRDGDEIWIAEGTYLLTPPNTGVSQNRRLTIFASVGVYGGFNGTETSKNQRDWNAHPTIISGDNLQNDNGAMSFNSVARSDNARTVVFIDDEAGDVTIDGLTIRDGNATLKANWATLDKRAGAGIFLEDGIGDLTLRNCILEKNVADIEAGVSLRYIENASVTIESCIFRNNRSRYASGAMLLINDVSKTLNVNVYSSLFYNNEAMDIDGVAGFSGSSLGLFPNNGIINANIINNTFTENYDMGTNNSNDRGTVVLRRLNFNTSSTLNANIHNNIFHQNYFTSGNVLATSDIGLMNRPNNPLNSMNFTNNITANEASLSTRVVSLTTNANNNADPLFTDALADDYRPVNVSPAVDAGDNTQVPASITEDLDGTLRIQGTSVDIGAYEFGNTLSNDTFLYDNKTAVNLYPNPVSSTLYFQTSAEISNISVYNHLGQMVTQTNQLKVDVSDLKSGLYLAEIQMLNGYKSVKKFIVN